jgi:hypothetical protein
MSYDRSIPSPCKGCGKPLGWLYSVNRPMDHPNVPVDWDTLHAAEQIALKAGQRVEFRKGLTVHFSTCPKADHFSKSKRKPDGPKQRTFEEVKK